MDHGTDLIYMFRTTAVTIMLRVLITNKLSVHLKYRVLFFLSNETRRLNRKYALKFLNLCRTIPKLHFKFFRALSHSSHSISLRSVIRGINILRTVLRFVEEWSQLHRMFDLLQCICNQGRVLVSYTKESPHVTLHHTARVLYQKLYEELNKRNITEHLTDACC